jgi:hypothetical protein
MFLGSSPGSPLATALTDVSASALDYVLAGILAAACLLVATSHRREGGRCR